MGLFPESWFRKNQLRAPTVQEIEEINDGSYRGTETNNQHSYTPGTAGWLAQYLLPGAGTGIYSYGPAKPVYASTANPGVIPTMPPAPELKAVRQDEPVRGFKGIRICTNGTGVWLTSTNFSTGHPLKPGGHHATCHSMTASLSYSRSSSASTHKAPHLGCNCGWYAYKTKEQVDPGGYGVIVAEVDLAGTVIEHEHGYRGEYQRILSVLIRPVCQRGFLCDTPPTHLSFKGGDAEASCEEHAHRRKSATIGRIAGLLGLEVRWDAAI